EIGNATTAGAVTLGASLFLSDLKMTSPTLATLTNETGAISLPGKKLTLAAPLIEGDGDGTVDGSLVLDPASTIHLEVNDLAGSQDTLRVNGQVNLNGAALDLDAPFTPTGNVTVPLIVNDLSDAVSGTFAGLPESSRVAGGKLVLSYAGL